MTPNVAGVSSSVEVFEEVLRLGGSVTRPTVPGGCGVGTDPPLAAVKDVPRSPPAELGCCQRSRRSFACWQYC
ncbi:UNVERIFIED_CONTAM: hypothetical protein Slati_2139700 [Sesamum latifolium]|uniref:Uncharacterized protein n=1 Tax=Sesamum latifolium TaxID=2727402 RepID=A0AAW2WRX0_9LAMI